MSSPIGRYKKIYLARPVNVQEGGVVTAISCFLLEKKKVDAVVAVRRSKGLEGKVVIATTPEDVVKASGSRWSLIPYMKTLRDTLTEGNIGRAAVIGLPCQMSFLRQMKEFPLLEADFGEKIELLIGLFCIGTFAQEIFKSYITSRYGIKTADVEQITISGDNLVVKDVSAKVLAEIPISEALKYLQTGCLLCSDYTSVSADISAGMMPEQPDATIIITRTDKGEDVMREAIDSGVISVDPAPAGVVEYVEKQALEKIRRAEKYMSQLL